MNNWIEAVKKPLEMITGRHAGARPEEPGAELVKPEQLQPRPVSYTHLRAHET